VQESALVCIDASGTSPVLTQHSFLAAHLKQIPLRFDFARDSPLLRDHSHLRKPDINSPILVAIYDNGESLVLTQSLNMLDFLEDSYPGRRRLIPSVTDMTARCKVKDLAALIVCGIEPMQYSRVLEGLVRRGQDPIVWARSFLAPGMRAFERMAEKSAGTYSVGNEVSIADICLVTMVKASYQYALRFDGPRDESGTTQFPIVQRIVKECEKIPGFTRAGIPEASFRKTFQASIDEGN